MAAAFDEFLESAAKLHKDCLRDSLTVVGVIGKDSGTWQKAGIVNEAIRIAAFQIDTDNPNVYIESFFCDDDMVLYLVAHGINDCAVRNSLFLSEKYHQKSFFEKIAMIEFEELSLLHIIFVLCHIVFVVEQGRFFDASIVKTLNNVNNIRMSAKSGLVNRLREVHAIPKIWADYGRLANPRLCFLFPARCIRQEMNLAKRREVCDKLDRGWETQINICLRNARVIDTAPPHSLASFSESTYSRCVRVIRGVRDEPVNVTKHLIKQYLDASDGDETSESATRETDCYEYFRAQIKDIRRTGLKSKAVACFPTLKDFITGATIAFNYISDQKHRADQMNEIMPELSMAQSIDMNHWERPVQSYRKACLSRGGYFSTSEHETELERAIESIRTSVASDKVDDAIAEVTAACIEFWENNHQRCEAVSTTGHCCKYGINECDRNDNHDSSFRFTSACNCGKRLAGRRDPFSLKDANCDFYQQFRCCRIARQFKFPIFHPSQEGCDLDFCSATSDDVFTEPTSPAKSPAFKKFTESEIIDTAALSGDTIDEEVDDEVDEHFDRFLDEDKLKEMFLDEKQMKDEGEAAEEGSISPSDNQRPLTPGDGSYLDTYDEGLRVDKPSVLPYTTLVRKYKGRFLEFLPHSEAPKGLLPGFPSWALTCIGQSNHYSHSAGLRLPGFKRGNDYLLPLDMFVSVNYKDWEDDMRRMNPKHEVMNRGPRRRGMFDDDEEGNREKVKFFIGFEYECPRGHRFIIERPNKALHMDKNLGPFAYRDEAANLLRSDIPVWCPCTCRRSPLVSAQLMRLHIVTPKAPISTLLDLRVQPSNSSPNGYFYPSVDPLELFPNRYYVVRFPFSYHGPGGPVYPPRTARTCGRLMKNWMTVVQRRMAVVDLDKT